MTQDERHFEGYRHPAACRWSIRPTAGRSNCRALRVDFGQISVLSKMWGCGDSATPFGDVVVVPEGNCGVENFAVLRTGFRYDTSPLKGSCRALERCYMVATENKRVARFR